LIFSVIFFVLVYCASRKTIRVGPVCILSRLIMLADLCAWV